MRRPAGSTRRSPSALLALALLLLALRVILGLHEARQETPAASQGPEAEPMEWRSLEAGVAEARAMGKPILYDFTADWCPPCRLMERQLFADPEVAADLNSRFVPVRVRDRMREEGRNQPWVDSLQRRFQVSAFPTLVAESLEGGEPTRIEGYLGRAGTLRQLRAAAARLRREESGAARTGAVSE
jgi:thiol:disulfide interchange protein